MSSRIQRSPITGMLLATLTGTGIAVGDAVAPRGNIGWVGQPNAEGTNFIPYAVLTPLPAQLGGSGGELTDPGGDVWFPYAITCYGVTREQVEDLADDLRIAAQRIRKVDIPQWSGTSDEYGRRIQSVVVQTYGAIQPLGDTDPRTYGQTDTVSLWTTG